MPGFRTVLLLALAVVCLKPAAWSQPNSPAVSAEQRASRYLDQVRSDPSLLLEFLRQMPKGGDLHNHLSGAVYAESYLRMAAADGLCLQRQTLQLVPPSLPAGAGNSHGPAPEPACDTDRNLVPARLALSDPVLYREAINAWSMRNFHPASESGADHFFDSFRKFGPATRDHFAEMLAEVVSRAGHENVQYLELILDPTKKQPANRLGIGLSAEGGNFAALRQQVLDRGAANLIAAAKADLDEGERQMRESLQCSTAHPDAGCDVTIRYLFEVHRALPPEQVFAEMVTGFEMASADPRVLGVNMVMPEDAYVSLRDFGLHMRMMDYLHSAYPRVRISLHAGELAPPLVPPEALRSHIRESLEAGHAERIGHGDDVMYERDPVGLLKEMAQHNVLVEICLTSNDLILGVRGMQHPLPVYMRAGVPVALATDDEGVSRSNLVEEFLRAVQTYKLSYAELKRMVRNSAQYSFLPGESLWAKYSPSSAPRAVAACAGGNSGSAASPACKAFLDSNERARLQWRVEQAFAAFEGSACCQLPPSAAAAK